jgi:hypothetical protein
MAVTYAKADDIQAMIVSIINANTSGEFSVKVSRDTSGDLRFSDAFIRVARRFSAARVMEAIGSNLAHPFWGELKTDVAVAHGETIPPCFGEIGTPEIKPVNSVNWDYIEGFPASADEIDSYRGDSTGSTTLQLFGNPLGETNYTHLQNTGSGVKNPLSGKYSTDNGVLKFTGYACRIPMIQVPDDGGRTLAAPVAVTSGSPNVVGSVLNAFSGVDLGKRIIVSYDNETVLTGIIQSLATTTLANDTAVTDTNAVVDAPVAATRTEDVYLTANDLLDNKIPLSLGATVARLSIGLLVKEGDSLRQIASMYAGQGEVDLIKIAQGATSVDALDVTRAIQQFQRYN